MSKKKYTAPIENKEIKSEDVTLNVPLTPDIELKPIKEETSAPIEAVKELAKGLTELRVVKQELEDEETNLLDKLSRIKIGEPEYQALVEQLSVIHGRRRMLDGGWRSVE